MARDKFMPEMHLKQPEFTDSTCGPFTKNKARIQRIKETKNWRYLYQNELDKACVQHGMAHGDFKDLTTRTGKIFCDKALKSINMIDTNQCGLSSMLYKVLIKKLQVAPLRLQINLLLKMKISQTINCTNQSFENKKKKIIVYGQCLERW